MFRFGFWFRPNHYSCLHWTIHSLNDSSFSGLLLPNAMSPKSNPRRSNQVRSRPRSHFHQLQEEPQGHQAGAAPIPPPPPSPCISEEERDKSKISQWPGDFVVVTHVRIRIAVRSIRCSVMWKMWMCTYLSVYIFIHTHTHTKAYMSMYRNTHTLQFVHRGDNSGPVEDQCKTPSNFNRGRI